MVCGGGDRGALRPAGEARGRPRAAPSSSTPTTPACNRPSAQLELVAGAPRRRSRWRGRGGEAGAFREPAGDGGDGSGRLERTPAGARAPREASRRAPRRHRAAGGQASLHSPPARRRPPERLLARGPRRGRRAQPRRAPRARRAARRRAAARGGGRGARGVTCASIPANPDVLLRLRPAVERPAVRGPRRLTLERRRGYPSSAAALSGAPGRARSGSATNSRRSSRSSGRFHSAPGTARRATTSASPSPPRPLREAESTLRVVLAEGAGVAQRATTSRSAAYQKRLPEAERGGAPAALAAAPGLTDAS